MLRHYPSHLQIQSDPEGGHPVRVVGGLLGGWKTKSVGTGLAGYVFSSGIFPDDVVNCFNGFVAPL
jgi:hypothetical protein